MHEIEKFVDMQRTDNTKEHYTVALNQYFRIIQADPNIYFNKERDYEKDVQHFLDGIQRRAPVTIKCYMNTVKNFLIEFDVELSAKFWKRIRKKMQVGRPITLDRAPTTQELKLLLSYGDLKTRTLFTLLASSGMRIGEVMQLKPTDIDLDKDPAIIKLQSKYTKNRRARITFCSSEAKDLLCSWLKPSKDNLSERDRYLQFAVSKIKGRRDKDPFDERLFPFTSSMARRMWLNLIHKANLLDRNEETQRYELHIHSLRKFFMSQLKTRVPETIVEALAGHSQYLDIAYKRYGREQLAEFYSKGMSALMIFETAPNLDRVNDELLRLKKENTDLREKIKIQEIRTDVLEIKLKQEKYENGRK